MFGSSAPVPENRIASVVLLSSTLVLYDQDAEPPTNIAAIAAALVTMLRWTDGVRETV